MRNPRIITGFAGTSGHRLSARGGQWMICLSIISATDRALPNELDFISQGSQIIAFMAACELMSLQQVQNIIVSV
jgi:hypothetical protein